jgi:putative endonuclease
MYHIYILQCSDDSLYTGITTNVTRRFEEHKNKTAAHYTRAHNAVKIVYTEECPNRSTALKREAEIKKWSREKKLAMIQNNILKICL